MPSSSLGMGLPALLIAQAIAVAGNSSTDWPTFRGPGGGGVAEGFVTRQAWDADPEAGGTQGVLWAVDVPGLGHSSPVISGDRIFLTTAIATEGEAGLKIGRGGEPDPADDDGEQSWVVLCYDRSNGEELWRRVARRGPPRVTRHAKATHANASVAVSGDRVVAFFGSEGIHCYDLDGEPVWSRDLGVIDVGKYGIGWGFASSPAIHEDRIAIVGDRIDNPFIATLSLADGADLWRVDRSEVCERSWGSPFIHAGADGTQVVVNGWPFVVSYDFQSGAELWRLRGGGDNPVPTPFAADGSIFVTSSHGGQSPIYVVRPNSRGDLLAEASEAGADSPTKKNLPEETLAVEASSTNEPLVWMSTRGGSYMSTPVVYGGLLYLGNSNGVLRCFDAATGKKVYERRLGRGASIIASLVAADGKVYAASEDGTVYVVRAGPDFEVLARNPMRDPCFATPAISEGVLYLRTTKQLVAIH